MPAKRLALFRSLLYRVSSPFVIACHLSEGVSSSVSVQGLDGKISAGRVDPTRGSDRNMGVLAPMKILTLECLCVHVCSKPVTVLYRMGSNYYA